MAFRLGVHGGDAAGGHNGLLVRAHRRLRARPGIGADKTHVSARAQGARNGMTVEDFARVGGGP